MVFSGFTGLVDYLITPVTGQGGRGGFIILRSFSLSLTSVSDPGFVFPDLEQTFSESGSRSDKNPDPIRKNPDP